MSEWRLVPEGDPISLEDCPIGLFQCGDGLCLKTEYGDNNGRIDAFIVSSGEFFWGAAPQTIQTQRAQIVQPLSHQREAEGEAMSEQVETPVSDGTNIVGGKPLSFIEGAPVVAASMFDGVMLAATRHRVYRWIGDRWQKIWIK